MGAENAEDYRCSSDRKTKRLDLSERCNPEIGRHPYRKGGTNAIIEYFGPGTESLSATGKATICNMGAEVGATTSLFPFDGRMATYLRATGRDCVVDWAESVGADLRADDIVTDEPSNYYDRVIEIDLSELEPYINGPFTPDAATPISEFAEKVLLNGYPRKWRWA